jgi:membrane-associated phospholipid phosphatase
MSVPGDDLTHPYIVLRPSQRIKLVRYTTWMWAIFIIGTLLMLSGLFNAVDQHSVLGLWHSEAWINRIARVTEKPGLRSIVYPVTLGTGIWLAVRRHDLHPPITAVWTLIATNAATGFLKLITFRPTPRQAPGHPEFFNTDWIGIGAYPSGHTANLGAAAALGVMAMFASRVRWRYWATAAISALCLLVAVSSWARDTHWLSDLVFGYVLGAAVAMTTSLTTADLPIHWRHPKYIGSTRMLIFAGVGITAGSFAIFAENSFLSHSNTSILIMLGAGYLAWRHRRQRRNK